jgi:hypothetical protein
MHAACTQNSTLVLTSENRSRDAHEPSSEPTTLWGKMTKTKMGDRALREKPLGEKERLEKASKKKRKQDQTQVSMHAYMHCMYEGLICMRGSCVCVCMYVCM